MPTWTVADIPDQRGKTVVITGATGGLGYESALALAGKGAEVILTGRNEAKGAAALANIRAAYPTANLQFELLDLASLASVHDFAERYARGHDRVDLLMNNGGVMAPPQRLTTADGFELQLGTNHLAHFALTAQLLPQLMASPAPRVVNVSSTAHLVGSIVWDDLNAERGYNAWRYYAQSKTANLMFTFELQRRSDAEGWGLFVAAAHPGVATTDLIANGPGAHSMMARLGALFQPLMTQPPEKGVLPQLFAATDPAAEKSGYYGPQGLFEFRGEVGPARVLARARDPEANRRLWEISERLTRVRYPARARAA